MNACVEGDWSRSVNKLFQLFQGADGRSYVLEGVEIGVLSCIFFLFLRGFGVYAGVCVWMRTHTHLQRLGTRDVS